MLITLEQIWLSMHSLLQGYTLSADVYECMSRYHGCACSHMFPGYRQFVQAGAAAAWEAQVGCQSGRASYQQDPGIPCRRTLPCRFPAIVLLMLVAVEQRLSSIVGAFFP